MHNSIGHLAEHPGLPPNSSARVPLPTQTNDARFDSYWARVKFRHITRKKYVNCRLTGARELAAVFFRREVARRVLALSL